MPVGPGSICSLSHEKTCFTSFPFSLTNSEANHLSRRLDGPQAEFPYAVMSSSHSLLSVRSIISSKVSGPVSSGVFKCAKERKKVSLSALCSTHPFWI